MRLKEKLFPKLPEELSKWCGLFDVFMFFMVITSHPDLTFEWRFWLYILVSGLVGLIPYVSEVYGFSRKTRIVMSVVSLIAATYPIIWLVVFIISGIRLFL